MVINVIYAKEFSLICQDQKAKDIIVDIVECQYVIYAVRTEDSFQN